MMQRIRNLGQQLGFVVVLAGFNEAIWHQPNVHPLLSGLGYLVFGLLFFDIITVTQTYHPLRGLILAGIFGTLQAGFISGNLGNDFPLGVALYGSGIGTLAFFAAYLIFFQAERWAWSIAVLTGLMSAFWIYGEHEFRFIEIGFTTQELVPNLILGVVGLGLGLGLNVLGRQNGYTPMPLGLTRPFLLLTLLTSVGLAGYQVSSDHLSALSFMVALVIIIVLPIMYWFIYLNKLYTQTQTLPKSQIRHNGFSVFGFALAYGVGYVIADMMPVVGDGVVVALILFGSSWLPLLSISLGFEAFVQLADEGIL